MGKANKTRKFAQVKRMISPNDQRLKKSDNSKQIKKSPDNPNNPNKPCAINAANQIDYFNQLIAMGLSYIAGEIYLNFLFNQQQKVKTTKLNEIEIRKMEKEKVSLFFEHNMQLGPPYHIIIDTNFINFSIQYKFIRYFTQIQKMIQCFYQKLSLLDIFQSMMNCLLAKCIPCVTDCVVAELEKMGVKYRLALKLTKDPRFQRLHCQHKGTYADDCLVDRVKQNRCYIVATNDKDLRRRIRKIPGVPIMYIAGHKYQIERISDDYGTM